MPQINPDSRRGPDGKWIINPVPDRTEEIRKVSESILTYVSARVVMFMFEQEKIGTVDFYLINARENTYEIFGLIVQPKYRRLGVATTLIKEGQKFASVIQLNCYDHPSLIELYSKCGFVVIGDGPMVNEEKQIRMEWRKQ